MDDGSFRAYSIVILLLRETFQSKKNFISQERYEFLIISSGKICLKGDDKIRGSKKYE